MTFTHAIIYTGAPYGENESGHIVSRHKNLENAEKAFDKKFDGATGVLENRIVTLKTDGSWDRYESIYDY